MKFSHITTQSLGALLKSAHDVMRNDKGLNGELDRLPKLTLITFLKFLDDLELQRKGEAKSSGKKFKPSIESGNRWRDWAAKSDDVLRFTVPDALKVPPISPNGNVNEIIGKLYGVDQPRTAVNQLQSLEYAS